MTPREVWQTQKKLAEEKFKTQHAKELLKVDQNGLTPYPVKFDQKLGPALSDMESAAKKNKPTDVAKYKSKAKEIVGKYKTLVNNKKTDLGDAWEPLNKGIIYLEGVLK